MNTATALFDTGAIVATKGAMRTFDSAFLRDTLERHRAGDWGAVDPKDKGANDRALKEGDRLMSVYPLSEGKTLWWVTEADRSVTTALLPSEY
jgi:hypothetical protein